MKNVIDEQFLQQLELFSLSVKDNVAGLFGGNHKSKKFGSSTEFADYREYQEGDDITKIDWNLYGKFEKLYLKLYLDERQMQTRIYIDTSGSMSYFHKDEMAVKIATALSYLSVHDMDRVSVYCIRGNYAEPLFEKVVGRDTYMNHVAQFNKIKFGGETHLTDAVIHSTVGYGDGRSILISDFLTNENFTDAIDYLRSKKRDVICMQVLSSEEMNPQFRGKTIIHDSEDDNHFYKDNISREVLKAYKKALDYMTKRLEAYCAAREADYLLVSTADEVRNVMLNTMVKRGIIR